MYDNVFFQVIADVKRTQADINLLEGKLYRTYVEADSKIFDLARADPQMIGAYKVSLFNDFIQRFLCV